MVYSKESQKISGQKLDFGHLEAEEKFLAGFHGFWQNMAELEKVSAEPEERFLAGFHGFWQNMAEPEKVSAEPEERFLEALLRRARAGA